MSAAVSVRGVFRDVTGKPFNADPAATRRLNRLFRAEAFLVATLPIARLNATQDTVNADFRDAGRRYAAGPDGLPAVVKYAGAFYVTDGHHRIMALAADGIGEASVRLYDLDGDVQVEFPLLDGLSHAPGMGSEGQLAA